MKHKRLSLCSLIIFRLPFKFQMDFNSKNCIHFSKVCNQKSVIHMDFSIPTRHGPVFNLIFCVEYDIYFWADFVIKKLFFGSISHFCRLLVQFENCCLKAHTHNTERNIHSEITKNTTRENIVAHYCRILLWIVLMHNFHNYFFPAAAFYRMNGMSFWDSIVNTRKIIRILNMKSFGSAMRAHNIFISQQSWKFIHTIHVGLFCSACLFLVLLLFDFLLFLSKFWTSTTESAEYKYSVE